MSASISTPVCPTVLASARISTATPSTKLSFTLTELRGRAGDVSQAPHVNSEHLTTQSAHLRAIGWQRGMSCDVSFAPWMPAIWATDSTSPCGKKADTVGWCADELAQAGQSLCEEGSFGKQARESPSAPSS